MNNYNSNIDNNNINSSSKQQMIIIKEGLLKKRSGRMVQWTTRYFTLYTTSLTYRTNQDQHVSSRLSTTTSYELVPGCLVTDITEEIRVNIKGKKLYSFWVVWPHDKCSGSDYDNNNNNNNIDDGNKEVQRGRIEIDSDGEQHHCTGTTITSADTKMSVDDDDDDSGHRALNAINQAIASSSLAKISSHQSSSSSSSSHGSSLTETTTGRKDVQSIVASEVMIQKRQRQLVEEQVEKHQAHDINVATGAKIAAVALGGVAIGVMTMVG